LELRPAGIEYLYYFSSNDLSVLEVKITGLPDGTPPAPLLVVL
jgi:hypothetical protein